MAAQITSAQNERVKLVRALQAHGKTRRSENRIVLEGARLIGDALRGGTLPTFAFFTSDAVAADKPGAALAEEMRGMGIECAEVTPEIMESVSDTQTPQGWLAVFPMPKLSVPPAITLALILDGIADPGNMGTVLRTSAAAAVDVVILAPNSVDPFSPKVLRGGMGAHFRVPIRRLTWGEIAEHYAALPVYLAEARADLQYTAVDWTQPSAILIGGEAHGSSEGASGLSTTKIAIPMADGVESLNASAATAVLLFEARRQRGS